MSNPYFKFKQFTVYHDLCAMKVGIDGVLLGAWTPVDNNIQNILDIGTGSGLIALMLAQRTVEARIDAIDIDDGAFLQSKININNSAWKDRINTHQISLQNYATKTVTSYDLIVSNPPYFIQSLKSADESRTKARHTDTLNHKSLLQEAIKILKKTGRICLILPVTEGLQCVKYAKGLSLSCYQCIYIHPTPTHEAKRVLLEFGFNDIETRISSLEIETNQRHLYSESFTSIVKQFYLKL